MAFVRDSKYRHVYGEALKQTFEDLRLSTKATESQGIIGNEKFFCFVWEAGGGGALAVVPYTQVGRIPRGLPLISGHSGAILDFEFNPFDKLVLASSSEDTTVKVWQIPDGGLTQNVKEPIANLEGHTKKVTACTWHPSASDVLASTAFDNTIKIWNVEEQAEAISLEIPDVLTALKWNYSGSLLAAGCKDKKVRVFDPRAKTCVAEALAHSGAKAMKTCWLGGSADLDGQKLLVTTGFTTTADRELCVWDTRAFSSSGDSAPVTRLVLDQASGALFPFFDCDTSILLIGSKGDTNVRYFELAGETLHYIDMFSERVPQRGLGFLPKTGVDTSKHEIMRMLRLETNCCKIVSFKVPRKSDQFQEDIYPNCFAGIPAMSPEAWIGGNESKMPITRPILQSIGENLPALRKQKTIPVSQIKAQLQEAEERIEVLEERVAALEKENAELRARSAC